MSEFKVGDTVECVRESKWPTAYPQRVGDRYTIEGHKEGGLRLSGPSTKPVLAERFRLVTPTPPEPDPVNRPAHYIWLPNGVEVIDITERFSFTLGNVLKYVIRADHKGKPLEDLRKARWYLDREIERREEIARRDSGV